MFIIGELINCTRKRMRAAAEGRDTAYIKEVAVKQADAGASMLDVNGGIAGQEAECLSWLVNVVQETVDLPLCLDSSDPAALRHALPLCKQRALINSIPDEPGRFEAVLPLLKEYRAKVIALCMAESGPPAGVEDRLATACRLVDRLTAEGLALEDIYVDPCVLPVSTGPEQWQIGGGGNQPDHDTVSRCAHQRGAEQCVLRPALAEAAKPELHGVAYVTRAGCGYRRPVRPSTHGQRRAAEALLGRDEYSAEYLRAFREGRLKLLVS